jgi:uncharacterized protein
MEKAGRNDPCPCGSGKKFKKCHGRQSGSKPIQAQVLTPQSSLSSFFHSRIATVEKPITEQNPENAPSIASRVTAPPKPS